MKVLLVLNGPVYCRSSSLPYLAQGKVQHCLALLCTDGLLKAISVLVSPAFPSYIQLLTLDEQVM